MSITTILSTATTGLMAAQTGLRTVSENVANANTPGYVRKVVDQSSNVAFGSGSGVAIDGIRRVVDRYLESASLTAGSTAGRASVLAEMLDRAQGLFGDPSGAGGFFDGLNDVFTQFAALANDPASSLQRSQSLVALQSLLDDSRRITASMVELQNETDTRIRSDVSQVNDLLAEIATLNADIRRARIGGADASGSENIQSQLVTQLAGLLNVQVTESPRGGVVVRTPDGMLLADERAGTLDYTRSDTADGFLMLTPADSGGQRFDAVFSSGELVGLLEARNREIPGALAQMSEFMAAASREINRAHNANSTVPAPASMTGRETFLDATTAAANFSGKTTIAIVDAAGVITNRIAIDFNAPTPGISLNGGPATGFTPATFISALDGVMTGIGDATFSANGALTISATSGGVAIVDDPADPALKAGVGFSQFFGLNDLVKSSTFPVNTGLAAGDPHGFTTGSITLRLTSEDGTRLRDVAIPLPGGSTMGDLLTSLNAPTSGVSPYGSFSLDANGRLKFNSAAGQAVNMSVVTDTTRRGASGPSISSFFGIGPAGAASAAASYAINTAIYQDPAKMAVARLNLSAVGPASALALGDGRGAAALAAAGEQATSFGAAGGLPATTMTLARYASEFSGSLGRKAATAETAAKSADSIRSEADNRRTSFEGVNTDEELVRMTTYQQAFNASARLIKAAQELYDVLLAMV